MISAFRASPAPFVSILVWLLSTKYLSHAAQSDIDCLRAVKASLHDPFNYLATWDFTNGTRSLICRFTGIDCWHEDDNNVLNIKLAGMGLEGEFPLGVIHCTTMTGLDLSNNNLHGHIPNNISHFIGFLTGLDLSSNKLSGEIPVDLANCTYLNTLKLDNNRLTGQIPAQIGLLGRLKSFSVSNNQLSGPVPQFVNATTIVADSYANNAGLCGGPLRGCQRPPAQMTDRAPAIIGAAAGCPLGFAISIWCYLHRQSTKKKQQQENDPVGNKWAKSIKGAKRMKLSVFEKSLSKVSLFDLMKATNNFTKENVIGSGRTGVMYRAVLQDGTSLMVKRLRDAQCSEKEFVSEMATLGNVEHRNLVPLIGFCSANKERFLVYRHMPNGTLHDKLHILNEGDEIMDWPLRLKIMIRAAKGLAWLHCMSWNPRTIHWNISSKCILLDADYEPKISTFVPAGLMTNPVDRTRSGRAVIDDEFVDNLGYVAPEYARMLAATPEGDVYRFGIVLLELVTREKPPCVAAPEVNLVEWISQLSSTSKLEDAIDGFLVGKGFYSEISGVLEVACNCVLPGPQERPTMFEVYQLLRAIRRRYDFATEILVSSDDAGDADHQLVELIVAQDI